MIPIENEPITMHLGSPKNTNYLYVPQRSKYRPKAHTKMWDSTETEENKNRILSASKF